MWFRDVLHLVRYYPMIDFTHLNLLITSTTRKDRMLNMSRKERNAAMAYKIRAKTLLTQKVPQERL
ncbi:uncharacterized protein PHALS_06858 [Plasmopara halstedii]|uniref:Uncharacterized protein n=1 Tax=Plasmopara halstedii TaxID=4781 RepID=A0A0P1B4M4_PLAHL|nr:uncharacterized protein PHALS_06858 [Plasmopara halstedii]CEG49072.1 hypothetical protein PHALS_06858 [Plasmopara halstedii]|eukprot:XP_024585441.1 hypothetical protein PHALS_06858 [Plasmopara halstedii]